MAASRRVEVSHYRSIGRQRRRRFGALSQVIRRTEIRFFLKYVVPAAKYVGADLMDFAAH